MHSHLFRPALTLGILATLVSLTGCEQPRPSSTSASESGLIFSKGQPAPAANFTGQAWVQRLVDKDDKYACGAGSVQFAPGARSNWHQHPAGQILLVVEGTGHYQEKGKPLRVLRKGDVIKAPAGVEHWHGAAPTSSMTHVAINPDLTAVPVVWGPPVTDTEYQGKP
ncbi:cupin domain-containing protein [Hymenobacter guriensis]|uniref:Cupin domain-containing protein n=1 Tax=Hymenobacter guriensis TaxID=2793065 RepID=A0ABS0L4I8_9BACT|nr:cupin domain-containing protein [Hymenobacter guriensis]MBG8555068.1 cupin domain-containing protein [Hymenobacter guriensis]